MARRSAPEVNAGSMADIAFLLLIFFLVTTTLEKDNGIARQLPPIDKSEIEPPKIKEKNLFIVLVNKNDQLLVNDSPMELEDLRESAIEFLDNGGALSNSIEYCDYCKGKRSITSSDNPTKAVISVQNELVAAYNFLRNRESQRLHGWNFTDVKKEVDAGTYLGDLGAAQDKLKEIQKLFPLKLSEAQPKKN